MIGELKEEESHHQLLYGLDRRSLSFNMHSYLSTALEASIDFLLITPVHPFPLEVLVLVESK